MKLVALPHGLLFSPHRHWFASINNQDFQVCQENIVRGLHAFFPPKLQILETYFDRGMKDAERFLKKEGMWDEDPEHSEYQHQYKVLHGQTLGDNVESENP